MSVVLCRNLRKVYAADAQPVHALRGVDLNVERGELLMLVGPSGCGKTTLISVIAGILEPTEGDCQVLGRNWRQLGARERAAVRARSVGFVFQQYQLIPTLTIQQNVCVPLLLGGKSMKHAVRRAAEVLDAVGLGDRLTVLPPSLSGGQQQRVAIARAVAHEPELIVCDEPTSALDHETGQSILRMLKQLVSGGGRTLIVVTHDARIFEYADRIAEMDDGHITGVRKVHGKTAEAPHVS